MARRSWLGLGHSRRAVNAALLRLNLRPRARERAEIVAVGLVVTIAVFLLLAARPATLDRLINASYDTQLSLLEDTQASSVPIIVEVDDRSLREFGQWPWPRFLIARLLQKLSKYGVAAVGVDFMFPNVDRSSPRQVQQDLKKHFGEDLPLESVPTTARDYDRILAETLAAGRYVLGYYFEFGAEQDATCIPRSASIAVRTWGEAEDARRHRYRASGITCSIGLLADAVGAAGFINSRPDDDGVYRRTPLLIEYGGRFFPSLALQTLLTARGSRQLLVDASVDEIVLRLDDLSLPLDAAGNLLIRFRGPGRSFEYVSAGDVLANRVDPRRLANRIAFLGASATALKDDRPTPLDPLFTGLEFHATVVDNILQGDPLRRPSNIRAIEWIASLLFGTAVSFLLAWAGAGAIALISPVVIVGLAAFSQWLIERTGLVVSAVPPVMVVVSVLLVVSLYKYWREQLRARNVMRQILSSQEAIIEGLGAMAEYRDPDTGGHINRTQNYARALAEQLRDHPRFAAHLDDVSIELMHKTAPLHDIGKIGIPDHVLLKEGPLSAEEFTLMKRHTEIGVGVIDVVQSKLGSTAFLRIAKDIILSHHEKWDGSGYPDQLAGEAIPVVARLMAVADVYDALISRRVYKLPYSHKTAVQIIEEGKGSHFDPVVVEAFLKIERRFQEIALHFLDSQEQRRALLGVEPDQLRANRGR